MARRAGWFLFAFALPLVLLTAGSAFFGGSGDFSGGSLRRPTTTTVEPSASPAALPPTDTRGDDPGFEGPVQERLSRGDRAPAAAEAGVTSTAPATTSAPPTSLSPPGTSVAPGTTSTTAPVTTTTVTAVPSTTTSTSSTTSTTQPPPSSLPGGDLRLWDTAWQIAAKASEGAMQEYVDRLAAAGGVGGQNLTGFWFSVVNINQDINTPNGFGHTFGSFTDPDPAYLDDVERLIAMAADRGLEVGIVVAWDGPNQFSVEHGKLTAGNAYQYGATIAGRWTRPGFAGRTAIDAWILGGDTTEDCCGGEHGAVWAEVVRGIEDAQAANGFSGPVVLLHTAPGQHLNYVGASWLDAHAPQTGHCADAGTASAWMRELADRGAVIWGNGEMRYEGITWACNGNVPISAQQVRDDVVAMKNLGLMENFVYGFDPRWNASTPGSVGMSAAGVSTGLQLILDEPGLIRPR